MRLLIPRGGEIGPHADGWGAAFYEGSAARIFKEPRPASESRCLRFISEYDYQSEIVVAHIRRANPPQYGRTSANTHPFEREWRGQSWVFAHNGKLPGIREQFPKITRFRPMGDTDSEYAFCLLLNRLAECRSEKLTQNVLDKTLSPRIIKLAALDEFNFLLSNGIFLIAFAHTKLHMVQRECLDAEGCQQLVTLLATTPLTDESWVRLSNGSLYIYQGGELSVQKNIVATALPESDQLVIEK